MAQLTINDMISQVRNLVKGSKQDSFLTDKSVYLLFKKHAAIVMRRLDERGKLTKFSSVFETLDYVELEEVDKVEATCYGPKSYATFRKTKLEMPMFTEGVYGPMVNSVTSLDGNTIIKLIRNIDIYNMLTKDKNFKYNKWKYCWYINDRLYFPNIDYPAVRIEGIFEGDISPFKCCYEDQCKRRQDQSLNVPDFILQEVLSNLIKDLMGQLQIPQDITNDNQNVLR